jgi:hypothetical protein
MPRAPKSKKDKKDRLAASAAGNVVMPAVDDSTALESAKNLSEYDQSRPMQLTLFEMLLPQERNLSNTIELYDFIPKYHWGKVERIGGEFLRALEREFECRGQKYKVKIRPASIEDKDGVERYYYPSKREEIVEDALRKFITEGQGIFLDDAAGVTFSLYQLQEELKRNGHSYSKQEIKDALLICARTNITVTTDDGSTVLVSNIFETLGLQTRESWKGSGEKTRAFVRFNALVSKSIKSRTFRQINYEKVMSYKTVVARQLHKRMSHHYIQASISQPYHILLSTIIRDFGLTPYARLRDNLRDVQLALDEMQEKDVLLSYKVSKVLENSKRNKLLDAKFTLIPNPLFVGEVTRANKRHAQIKDVKLPHE